MEMTIDNPSLKTIAFMLLFIGFFLFISGLNIIKIEKISTSKGVKTWGTGLFLIIIGSYIFYKTSLPYINEKFYYVCYDKKFKKDNKVNYFNCSFSEEKCPSLDKQFGRYLDDKTVSDALKRCINNTPKIN